LHQSGGGQERDRTKPTPQEKKPSRPEKGEWTSKHGRASLPTLRQERMNAVRRGKKSGSRRAGRTKPCVRNEDCKGRGCRDRKKEKIRLLIMPRTEPDRKARTGKKKKEGFLDCVRPGRGVEPNKKVGEGDGRCEYSGP